MRKVKEVLRLAHVCGLSQREIAISLCLSRGSVSGYLRKAAGEGLTWDAAESLSDSEVEQLLFRQVGRQEPKDRVPIDFEWVHRQMRHAGVTLQLLWQEYIQAASGDRGRISYKYSQFCELYRGWRSTVSMSMRQIHRAGEKAYLDYSGVKVAYIDKESGERVECELFLMIMGASNYTYVEASRSQRMADFIGSTIRGLEYFGAVPQILVPDQLRSAVSHPDRYEPDINPTYMEMAKHYGMAIVPARPRKPKDKAKVEAGVRIAQRWIVACLRNRRFYSLTELNEAIAELREKLNSRKFQKLEGCRASAFETVDKPAMKPLPATRFELVDWRSATVNIDYLIAYDNRLYSVPCAYISKKVEIRATSSIIEILYNGQRIASHSRCYGAKGKMTIVEQHRPRSHQEYGKWTPERIQQWASSHGEHVGQVAREIIDRYQHPEAGYRPCLGLIRLGERFGKDRLNAACKRAIELKSSTYKTVRAILDHGLDRLERREDLPADLPPVEHCNLRGPDYYN